MKKSKFVTGLSAAFISAMALMSCSSLVRAKDGVVLTIDGIPYTAEQLFEDQKTPAAAEAKFNAIYRVSIRNHFLKGHPGYSEMQEITRNTKIKISEQKAIAQSNAEKSGTSYDEEWQKILDANDVEDEDGLYDKFEYDLQKEKFENKFYDDNYDILRNGGKFHDAPDEVEAIDGYMKTKMPYHMKHILVKVGAADGDNTTGTITKDEAVKLHDVITSLAKGDRTFESLAASSLNDDTESRKTFGSLGIMSRDTSFVDDFKLGTYLYEAFFGASTTRTEPTKYGEKNAKNELFGKIGEDYAHGDHSAGDWADKIVGTSGTNPYPGVLDPTTQKAIGVIPYEAALALGEEDYDDPLKTDASTKKGLADFEFKDQPLLEEAGISKDQFKDKYLPRNVIFNKYFNKHNIMVIAPTTLPDYNVNTIYDDADPNAYIKGKGEGSEGSIRTKNKDSYFGKYQTTETDRYELLPGFSNNALNPKNGDDLNFAYDTDNHKNVLRDQNGRVILVFRSGTGGSSSNEDTGYQGIHFIVIERSPFIGNEFDNKAQNDKETSLDDYYTVYYPGQTGAKGIHPIYNPEETDPEKWEWKHTFVNYIMDDVEPKNKKERAETVKSELKKCDNLNTYLYDYLVENQTITFTELGEKIKEDVADWVTITRTDTKHQTQKSWNENWQKFYYSLKAKRDERDEYDDGASIISRLIPEACAIALTQYGSINHQTAVKNLKNMFGVGGVFHE